MHHQQAIGGIVVLLFGAVTVVLSLRMPMGSLRAAGPGLFPLCLGILLMLLSGMFILTSVLKEWKGKKTGESASAEIAGSMRQVTLFLGTIVLATFLLSPLGYPLVSFLLLLALMRILRVKEWSRNVLISFLASLVSYLLFVRWLMIPLPKGWIGL